MVSRPLRRRGRGFACVAAVVLLGSAVGCTDDARTSSAQPSANASPTALPDDTALGAEIENSVQAYFDNSLTDAYDDVRAVLVFVDGRQVVERYYDSSAGATSNVHSVTKSVMSMLIGIALDEGHLANVDQPLGELLPAYADHMDSQTSGITLQQVLTMNAGLPAQGSVRDVPYFAEESDWIATILSEGPVVQPGQDPRYSTASSHLLSAILVEATGRSVLQFAQEELFAPLGIDTRPAAEPVMRPENARAYEQAAFAWPTDPQGYHVGFGNLKLTAQDMARLGQLYLDDGRWRGTQVVSSSWVDRSTRAHVALGADSYGFQWWVTEADGHPAFAAQGFGGQLIEVVPDLDLVVVVSSDDALPNPSPDAFTDLVSSVIAPEVRP